MFHPKRSGFTLLELLIVVAIISVLSTIGVPTFRRMIAKSRQAEAKTNLGGIYTAEAAFHSEYGIYLNALRFVGFEMEGLAPDSFLHAGRYNFGFPASGLGCGFTNAMVPDLASPFMAQTVERFPALQYPGDWMLMGVVIYRDFPSLQGGGLNMLMAQACLPGHVAADGESYLATASGLIAPGADDKGQDPDKMDTWSMNQDRALTHVHEAVQ